MATLSVPVGLVIARCSSTSSPAAESSAFLSACAGPNPLELSKSEIQNQCNRELSWMQKNDLTGIGPANSQPLKTWRRCLSTLP